MHYKCSTCLQLKSQDHTLGSSASNVMKMIMMTMLMMMMYHFCGRHWMRRRTV